MKKAHFLLSVLIIVSGCATNSKIPEPTTAMAEKSGCSLEKLKQGREVYMKQCARCHEPMMPSEISAGEWHVIVPGMAWNAGISEADEDAVLKYIMAAQ